MKRRLIITALIALSFILLMAGILPMVGKWYIQRRLIPTLGQRFHRQIRLGSISLGFSSLCLENFTVRSPHDLPEQPLAFFPEVVVDYKLFPLLSGRLVASRVLVKQPTLHLIQYADGTSNFRDLLSQHGPQTGQGRLRIQEVQLDGGQLTWEDRQHRLSLVTEGLQGSLSQEHDSQLKLGPVHLTLPRLAGPIVFAQLEVAGRLSRAGFRFFPQVKVNGGRIPLLPHLELSGIHGSAVPEGQGPEQRMSLRFEGSYGGAEAKLWSAEGWLDLQQQKGTVNIKAAKFSLGRIASILHRTPIIQPDRTLVDGDLKLGYDNQILSFQGGLTVKALSIFHPRLARTPVLDLSGGVKLKGRFESRTDKLVLDELILSSPGVTLQLNGFADRLFGKPLLDGRLRVSPVPCQTLLTSLPPALLPQLQGFELNGTFSVDLHTRVDFQELDQVELGGRVGINKCKVVQTPESVNAERLQTSFDHEVEVAPGKTMIITVGPTDQDFTPYADISQNIIHALLTTEDAGFFNHHGFIPSQFRNALSRNLKKGGFRLGASTISMQMVKNVLLGHEKTLSRKLQELFLTWYLERNLTKERTLEIYLNVIEFGPAIYGIGAASRHFFGKSPKDLTPLEAAFFATIIPSPKRRYLQYCHGELMPAWDRYVRRVLKRMAEKGYVDEAGMATAAKQKIVFSRDLNELSEAECLQQLKDLLDLWDGEEKKRFKDAVLRAAPHQVDMYLGSMSRAAKSKTQ